MHIKAFKMDGLGNDFVIIDNREKITNLTKDQIVKICDRNFIGCDQLIFIEPDSSADASLRFFNSDGGESGACGNGTRCVANLISSEKNNKLIISDTGVNTMSISEITHIPRPTVVRKLNYLLKNKYISVNKKKLFNVNMQDKTLTDTIKLQEKNVLSLSHLIFKIFRQINIR